MKTQVTRFLYVLLLTQFLTACFLTDMINPDRTVQERVSDVKIVLTAAASSIGTDKLDNLITKQVAQERLDKVKDARDKVRKVEEFIKLGDLNSAELKLKVVEASMTNIREYISKKAMETQ